MTGFFSKVKERLGSSGSTQFGEGADEGYVELGAENAGGGSQSYTVRPFTIEDFESIKPILDCLREGHTIALVNIKPLKDKDLVELKRAINKLKKTCDAIEGDIAGFGDNWIAAVPPRFRIHRSKPAKQAQESVPEVTEYD